MPSILGKIWRVHVATNDSPFSVGDTVEITADTKVIWEENQWQGEYLEAKDKVVVLLLPDTYWEFVGSESFNGKFIMHGSSWTTTSPDAMAAWVSDPQGGPGA